MAKFKFGPILDTSEVVTARTADGAAAADQLTDSDAGKLVKFTGDSQYGLCAVGDAIDGVLVTPNYPAPADGYNLGGVQVTGRVKVTLDGLQATPGTGAIAVGDYVVAGTVVARATALGSAFPKVCKATNQPGAAVTVADNLQATINAALAKVVDSQAHVMRGWRVVSLISGTGAVGQTALIERVS